MDKLFMIVGMAVVGWGLVGVVMTAFNPRIYISPSAPWSVRLQTLFHCAYLLPFIFLKTGKLAGLIVREEDESEGRGDPAEQARFDAWMKNKRATCKCAACKERRGEA